MWLGLMGSALGCALGTIWIGSQSRRRDASIEMLSAAAGLLMMGTGTVLAVLSGAWGGELAAPLGVRQIIGMAGSVVLIGLGVASCWMTFAFQLVTVGLVALGAGGPDVFRDPGEQSGPVPDDWYEDFEQFEKREGGL